MGNTCKVTQLEKGFDENFDPYIFAAKREKGRNTVCKTLDKINKSSEITTVLKTTRI
jgi:hypothetical protein